MVGFRLLYNEDENLAAISSSVGFVRFGWFQFGSSILDKFYFEKYL
jgi:hypothetical protein